MASFSLNALIARAISHECLLQPSEYSSLHRVPAGHVHSVKREKGETSPEPDGVVT